MKRSRSLYRVRVIAGHGRVSTSVPAPSSISPPSESRIFASIPGKGTVAEPGLVVVSPGSGVIMIAPVSVCHHVSTTGQRPPPMCSWYHSQARGLIGSPTVPFPGIEAKILDSEGGEIEEGAGTLVLTRPWPAITRTLYKE